MKKGLKIALIVMIGLVLIVGIVLACCQYKYLNYKNDYQEFKDNVLGKSSAEVEELYGEFDETGMPRGDDGLYRNTRCSYIVIEARVGYLGTTPPWVVSIGFDANGIADSVCFEQGGFGG